MTGPFDLDAARAARREADDQSFPFTFGGQQFTIPPSRQWPIQVSEALADGELHVVMRLLLGDVEYETFRGHGAQFGDIELLLTAMGQSLGVGGLPNSGPPRQLATTRT